VTGSMTWVTTEIGPDGRYESRVTFEEDGKLDVAIVLDWTGAVQYAQAVLAAATAAEYDSLIVQQFRGMDMDTEHIALVVSEFRKRQPKLRDPFAGGRYGVGKRTGASATGLFSLTPGVSAETGEPFMVLKLRGKPVGQWTPADAREHAAFVLEIATAAEYDQLYFETLTEDFGLDAKRAYNAVHGLQTYRPKR
jgi:hypothetical protein